jgi:hypothetical protein
VYRRACAHSDSTVNVLDLDSPAHVAHWPEGQQDTTLGVLLIRMVNETAQHAGHAGIIRELIDNTDDPSWSERRTKIQQAADSYRAR